MTTTDLTEFLVDLAGIDSRTQSHDTEFLRKRQTAP